MSDAQQTLAPCVSVVIPVYNCEAMLIETLESVLTQDLRNIEVICVDDGSTDRSAYIVEQLASTDPRLRLISQKNAGASSARNTGIDAARGEFITFLDADDWYEEDSYLSALYEGAKRTGLDAAGGCMVNWRGENSVERDFADEPYYDGYEFRGESVVGYADWQFDYGFTRFIFARKLFEGGKHRFGYLRFFEDPVFFVRIMDDVGEFFATDKAHYMYRCAYKPHNWTTGHVLDLMQGVLENLEYSRERGYARLHRYTARHFDFNAYEIGVGINPALAVDVLEVRLEQLEQALSQDLLAEAGEPDLPLEFRMRKAIDGVGSFDVAGKAYRWARYLFAHR